MNQTILSDQNLATTLTMSMQSRLDGFVHVQITLATTPSVSTYMQSNYIIVKMRWRVTTFLHKLSQESPAFDYSHTGQHLENHL